LTSSAGTYSSLVEWIATTGSGATAAMTAAVLNIGALGTPFVAEMSESRNRQPSSHWSGNPRPTTPPIRDFTAGSAAASTARPAPSEMPSRRGGVVARVAARSTRTAKSAATSAGLSVDCLVVKEDRYALLSNPTTF